MTKRLRMLAILAAVLVVPSLVFAGAYHQLGVVKAEAKDANTVVVPLQITNQDNLAAVSIPLSFSDGVTLEAVDFEETRVSYFDLKVANIDNENNTVVIGLLPQMTQTRKPDLTAGTGPIAQLVFSIDDPTVTEVTLDAVELKEPDHSLMFVYHDFSGPEAALKVERPEFDGVTVSLSGIGEGEVPNSFSLSQNYPNPFNPSTTISFTLKNASDYTLNVYNITGQQVESFSGAGTPGQNEVTFNASSLASGVYFYKLDAEGQTATKKMMLLK